MEEHKCEKSVWSGYHSHTCGKRAKMEHQGKWYCGIHDPVRKAEKDKTREERWKKEWAEKRAGWAREEAVCALCEGVSTEALQRLGKGWLKQQMHPTKGGL